MASSSAGPSAGLRTPSNGPEPKRAKRGNLSCAECRRLKLKCERGPWPCSSCVRRGCASVCPDRTIAPTGRTSKLAADASALVERVQELESLLRGHGLGELIPPPLELKRAGKGGIGQEEVDAKADGSASSTTGMDGRGAGTKEEPDVELIRSGVGSLTMREDGSVRYLGVSAGLAYAGEIETDDSDQQPDDPSDMSAAPLSPSASLRSSSRDPNPGSPAFPFISTRTSLAEIRAALPCREEAIRLSSLYWNNCSFMFTPVEYGAYYSDYFESAYTEGETHGAKLACVFMVLALASQFDPEAPATENADSHRYLTLSQAALSASRFLSHNTLAALQTLHLAGNVLFNRQKLQESGESFFPLLGMAIKMAVTLGLHRDPASWELDEEEANRRRLAFWELLTLDRLQAFISGRPYTIHNAHFDTTIPTNATDYMKAKWKLAIFIGKVIDGVFSPKPPTYALITSLDQELRKMYQMLPESARCPALPPSAFLVADAKPTFVTPSAAPVTDLKTAMEQHTLTMLYAEILLYMHKVPFAQALEQYPQEPLRAPWATSVTTVLFEAGPYVMKIVRSWIDLDPVICPRWWHMFFHLFVAGVAQSSLLIKAPTSILVSHVWQQLNETCSLFEAAAQNGAPVAMLVPRIHALRRKALDSLQQSRRVPAPSVDPAPPRSDPGISILGTTTELSRSTRRRTTGGANSAVPPPLASTSSDLPISNEDSAQPSPSNPPPMPPLPLPAEGYNPTNAPVYAPPPNPPPNFALMPLANSPPFSGFGGSSDFAFSFGQISHPSRPPPANLNSWSTALGMGSSAGAAEVVAAQAHGQPQAVMVNPAGGDEWSWWADMMVAPNSTI
ncbi:hypothetical protein JCM1840_000932 [Sporobolomyces johnsonii]